ncbi:MAG: hypothetical protein ACYSUI_19835, partial [Planctomycetota bacterium]
SSTPGSCSGWYRRATEHPSTAAAIQNAASNHDSRDEWPASVAGEPGGAALSGGWRAAQPTFRGD